MDAKPSNRVQSLWDMLLDSDYRLRQIWYLIQWILKWSFPPQMVHSHYRGEFRFHIQCPFLFVEIMFTFLVSCLVFLGWTLRPCHVSICTCSFFMWFGEVQYYWIFHSVWSFNCQKGPREQWIRGPRWWVFRWIGFPCWYSCWVQWCWHFANFGRFEWCPCYWCKEDNHWR